MKIRSKR